MSPDLHRFLEALSAIPYGETRTYGDLARALGIPPQASGQACGANPIAILIPCHRVLAADGLGGYSGEGGIETKIALLRLEGAASLSDLISPIICPQVSPPEAARRASETSCGPKGRAIW